MLLYAYTDSDTLTNECSRWITGLSDPILSVGTEMHFDIFWFFLCSKFKLKCILGESDLLAHIQYCAEIFFNILDMKGVGSLSYMLHI